MRLPGFLPRFLTAPFDTDAFFDVPTRGHPTRLGEVDLPIKYRDASAVVAMYPVPIEAARAQTRPMGVEALEVSGGRGLVWVVWFEYRETSVGPYNELAVGVLAGRGRPGPLAPLQSVTGFGPTGVAILHLPVTTPVAWAAGVDLWGYPKIVADIRYDWTPGTLEARLDHEDRQVVSMRIPLGRGAPVPLPNIATLSVRDETILKTVIRTHALARLGGGAAAVLRVEDPAHPLGRTLTELQLPERPAAILHVPQFRSLLPAGEVLGQAPRPLPHVEAPVGEEGPPQRAGRTGGQAPRAAERTKAGKVSTEEHPAEERPSAEA